ncbi:MAG: phosphotransferase [Chloroflexi bacterium]|nr:phosphotransferase [Chloroflexota bacterium]
MNHFPVSKSFLLRDALAHQIEEEYGLANVRCQLITATLRDVYLVTSSQGRHVLYVYRHGQRSNDEVSAEWQFVDYLYDSGVPVAPAVPRKSGEYLLSFLAPEGIRLAVLTQFAKGQILRRRPSIAAVRAYGQITARIHALADRMPFTLNRPALNFEKMMQDSVTSFEKELFDRPSDLAYLHESATVLQTKLDGLRNAGLSYGLIHGDVIRANALVADDHQVTVLDFDFCGFGWRAYDVASYLLTIRNTPQEPEFERAFLEGYEEIRPLAREDKAALGFFEAIRAIFSIGVSAMNIEHWGSQYFYAFVDNDLAALKRSMDRIL